MLGQQRQRLLRLAQGISEKNRHLPVRKGVVHKAQHRRLHLHHPGENQMRQPEGRLHDQSVRLDETHRLRRPAPPHLEVTGIEQGRPIPRPRHVQHRRAGDVPRRQDPQPEAILLHHCTELHRLQPRLRHVETLAQKPPSHHRTQRPPMARKMIRVSMRNEGGILCLPGVQPEVHFWQIQSTVETNLDHSTHANSITTSRKLFRHGNCRLPRS